MTRSEFDSVDARSPSAMHHGRQPEGAIATALDPFDERFLTDPPFAELLDLGPVLWSTSYDVVMVARHEQVREVLSDWQTYSSARGVGMADLARQQNFRLPSVILEVDPPAHDHARAALNKALSTSVLRGLKADFLTAAHALVDEVIANGGCDGIADLAQAYPLKVFPRALGMRPDYVDMLLPFGDMVFNSFGPPNERFKASSQRAAEVFSQIEAEALREHLSPEGFGVRIYECADRGEIPERDAHKLVRALLTAGVDTTVNGLGAALYCFTRFPEQWARLRSNPALARQAFEEAIRFESPVQTFFRTVTRPTTLAGVPLEEGQKILMFLGAANRDPRKWGNPDEFDIERRAVGHVGLGAGVHMCVGQGLARLEAECLLTALAEKVCRIEPAGPPKRRFNNTLRGLDSLPLKLTPVSA